VGVSVAGGAIDVGATFSMQLRHETGGVEVDVLVLVVVVWYTATGVV
jgi:hypothetical protein